MDRNDASLCWKGCPVRYPVSARPNTESITKVVVYTNTFCPLACEYCSLAYPRDAEQWTGGPRPRADEPNVWQTKNRHDGYVPPVRVRTNNTPSLLPTLKKIVRSARPDQKLTIEFTGGDSAYHPEFLAALDFLGSESVSSIYLSSGVVPAEVRKGILEHVASGLLSITASPDAINPETWSAIKRMPARLFDVVLEFLHAAASVQKHNQVAAKFIVTKQNLIEAPVFTQFYAVLGLKKFVLSECRAQPMHFVSPASEEELQVACHNAWLIFTHEELPPESELIIIGLERHFGGRSFARRSDVSAVPWVNQ